MDKYEVINCLQRLATDSRLAELVDEKDLRALETAAEMISDEHAIAITDSDGNVITTFTGKEADSITHMAIERFVIDALERAVADSE